ncbi:RNA-directed DNA polymerase, eukaryota [Tanacetum coccineum]
MVDGIWTESPNMVKREFFQHFKSRFDKPDVSRAYINMNYPKTISLDQQVELEFDVSKEEIKRAVWDYGTDKSPGPDGFTFRFYRRFWKIIENDLFEAVMQFFTYGDIPKGCNSSFIALISKILDANLVKDFRPISLIGSLYKIIAKIMANLLVGVLGDIVNEVDFEKAYDSVRWDFLDDVLKKFGFGDKWCNWIQSCLRSLRGSIIINGSPTEEFQFFKGLKQGDLLSPFLFILIMESLHLSFQRVVDAGMFKGIKLSSSLNLSYMFYADDAVFVGQWCEGNINTLVHMLECFYRASGTKVGGSMSRIQAWNEVVDRVKARLSKWKMKALSIRESIRSHFFNGHELKSKKSTWVKWNNVLAPKEKGGLGVSSLYALNRGLMCKWVWRFYTHNASLWVRVIKAIHGDKGKGNALKDLYPRMYALETCKSMNVGTKLAHSRLDSSFHRKPRGDVEQEQYEALSGQVHDVTLVPIYDRWIWSLESSGEFSVASIRKVIDDKRFPEVATKTWWIKYVPIKVNIHAWKVKIDSLPMRINISRRVDVVFVGAFGGVGDKEVFVGEGVVVTSSSLEMLTKNCLGGIMVSLIFLEGLDEEEALVEFMVELFEEDEDGKKNEKDGLFNLKAYDQSRKA